MASEGVARVLIGLVGCIFGGAVVWGFHDVASIRAMLPLAPDTMACADLDAYVAHVADLPDYHYHRSMFGVHRQDTLDAVNELYDRAHCVPSRTGGRETYKTLTAQIIADDGVQAPAVAKAPAPTPATEFATVAPPRQLHRYGYGYTDN